MTGVSLAQEAVEKATDEIMSALHLQGHWDCEIDPCSPRCGAELHRAQDRTYLAARIARLYVSAQLAALESVAKGETCEAVYRLVHAELARLRSEAGSGSEPGKETGGRK